MAASMFMNSNSLPIALMQSLVLTVHGLKWTPDDNQNAMLGRALTYLVLYSTLGMMVRSVNSNGFHFGFGLGYLSWILLKYESFTVFGLLVQATSLSCAVSLCQIAHLSHL